MPKITYDLPDKVIKAIKENSQKRQLTADELVELAIKRELKIK